MTQSRRKSRRSVSLRTSSFLRLLSGGGGRDGEAAPAQTVSGPSFTGRGSLAVGWLSDPQLHVAPCHPGPGPCSHIAPQPVTNNNMLKICSSGRIFASFWLFALFRLLCVSCSMFKVAKADIGFPFKIITCSELGVPE